MANPLVQAFKVLRAILFLVAAMAAGLLVFVLELLLFPIVFFTDKNRFLYHRMNAVLARLVIAPFFKVKLEGLEHLRPDVPCVIAANHQSVLDAFILALLAHVNFKVTFKRSIAFYPGVGQAFLMAGHVMVNRGNKSSGKAVISKCEEWIRRGACVLFFPEGTRKVDGTMGEFKAGAFLVATATQVPIVPVTIDGARKLMPPRGLPALGFGTVTLTVHPPIPSVGKTVDTLMAETKDVILSAIKAQ